MYTNGRVSNILVGYMGVYSCTVDRQDNCWRTTQGVSAQSIGRPGQPPAALTLEGLNSVQVLQLKTKLMDVSKVPRPSRGTRNKVSI